MIISGELGMMETQQTSSEHELAHEKESQGGEDGAGARVAASCLVL